MPSLFRLSSLVPKPAPILRGLCSPRRRVALPAWLSSHPATIAVPWMPRFGSALSSICCPAIATALVPLVTILLVAALTGVSPQRGGRPGLMPVLGAVFFGHMPDRLGGAKVALICVLIEAAGLALIWLASGLILAAVGSALTGFGYSQAP